MRIQSHQHFEVAIFLARKLPDVLLLEIGQSAVLFVELAFVLFHLTAQKISRVLRSRCPVFQIFPDHNFRQPGANRLRFARGSGRVFQKEPWHVPLSSSLRPAIWRDADRLHRIDVYVIANFINLGLHGITLCQLEVVDHRSQVFSAKRSLLEGCDAVAQILRHHGRNIPFGDFLPLDKNRGLRRILRRKGVGHSKPYDWRQQRRYQDDLQATPQHCRVIVHGQFAILNHVYSRSVGPWPAENLVQADRTWMPVNPNCASMLLNPLPTRTRRSSCHRATGRTKMVKLVTHERAEMLPDLPA